MLPDGSIGCSILILMIEKLKLRIDQKLIFYRKLILGLVSIMQLCKNLLYIFAVLPLSRYENWCQMSVRLFVVYPDTIKTILCECMHVECSTYTMESKFYDIFI